MLRLYDRIGEAHRCKQLDLLVNIYQLVKPFSFTDGQLFKFDLFALDAKVIERLEKLLSIDTGGDSKGLGEGGESGRVVARCNGGPGDGDDAESSKTMMARSKT